MLRRAIIITIILNSVILIGVPAGHGYGLMAMFEFLSIPYLIRNGIELGIMTAFISLIGKVFLIVSLFYKELRDKRILIYAGLLLVLIPFMSISYEAWQYDNFLFKVTFGSGIHICSTVQMSVINNVRTIVNMNSLFNYYCSVIYLKF